MLLESFVSGGTKHRARHCMNVVVACVQVCARLSLSVLLKSVSSYSPFFEKNSLLDPSPVGSWNKKQRGRDRERRAARQEREGKSSAAKVTEGNKSS